MGPQSALIIKYMLLLPLHSLSVLMHNLITTKSFAGSQ